VVGLIFAQIVVTLILVGVIPGPARRWHREVVTLLRGLIA
jgi:hypothetical protein